MEIDNLTLGDIKKLQCLFKGESEKICIHDEPRIVILQRGWVFVGMYHQDGHQCKLTKCQNIRNWGTTKGLGEIAKNGPTSDTKLDPTSDVEFHALTVIATIKCNEDKWKSCL